MVNLILCGGSGTRMWPLSRQAFPKQFVKLLEDRSLFQGTVKRNSSVFDEFCIVTNKDHYFIAENQMGKSIKKESKTFVLEPLGRNTAPAIALACFNYSAEEIIFVTPSDHLIKNISSYEARVQRAVKLAKEGRLVTFGIKPEYAETGYGYIEAGAGIDDSVYTVKSFREKPDQNTAETYIKEGNYYWNSGMFVFKAGVYLEELKKYSPEIYASSLNAYNNSEKLDDETGTIIHIFESDMKKIPSNSIDYAVMEKSDRVYVVASDIGWTDLGSYDAICDIVEIDENGNSKDEKIVQVKSKNNLVISANRKIALAGVENLIVVDTDDALLVSAKGFSQDVKGIVDILKDGSDRDNELTILHTTVERPWGTYRVLHESDGYKVKEIVVKPGKRLSLQKHAHRGENWVVVKGEALVQIGDTEYLKKSGESAFIPAGALHRLSNKGEVPLIIIETQSGDYLGEDDIIRVEDDYKRIIED